jgi:hypothetical protein
VALPTFGPDLLGHPYGDLHYTVARPSREEQHLHLYIHAAGAPPADRHSKSKLTRHDTTGAKKCPCAGGAFFFVLGETRLFEYYLFNKNMGVNPQIQHRLVDCDNQIEADVLAPTHGKRAGSGDCFGIVLQSNGPGSGASRVIIALP